MKKKLILIISAIVVIASIVYLIVINTDKENKTTVTDAEKFKTEYEKINGDINEKYNVVTREVDIPKDNPIVYISPENLVEKMDNKETFVVYFGFANCPWCRSVIETMFKVAKDYKINKNGAKNQAISTVVGLNIYFLINFSVAMRLPSASSVMI